MSIKDVKDALSNGDEDETTINVKDLDPEGNNAVHVAITAGRARITIMAAGGEVAVKTERLKVVDLLQDEEDFRSEVQVLSQINEA